MKCQWDFGGFAGVFTMVLFAPEQSKVVYFFGLSGNYMEVRKMLALTVKAGDYITIGDDIVIQVLKVGDLCRVAIDAPRELAIEREKVHEINAQTPECIRRVRKMPPKQANSGFNRAGKKSG